MYLKKLSEANDNPRYAASKHGSVVGGLICGLARSKPQKEESVKEGPVEQIEDIEQDLVDADIEGELVPPLEEDEITFVGETESAFFNYLKQG